MHCGALRVFIVMSPFLDWSQIALRLLCAAVAGIIIGLNRGEHRRPAGLRTTLLVSLASCIVMIQANLLLSTTGKGPASFVNIDVMRLPLGVLSGMGFIGAGAILRRESRVLGVTTAATLWFVTILGLCFGGGQILLGLVGLVLGAVALIGLKSVEARLPQERQGNLTLTITAGGPSEDEVRAQLLRSGFRIAACTLAYDANTETRELVWSVRWHGLAADINVPPVVETLIRQPGVIRTSWSSDS